MAHRVTAVGEQTSLADWKVRAGQRLLIGFDGPAVDDDLRRLVRETIEALIVRYKLTRRVGVGVMIVDAEQMIELNREHMGKDAPTDVLAFPLHNGPPPDGDPAPYLGDVVVSIDQATLQAAERGHALEAELRLLVVHGFLHLLGFDDTTPVARRKMNAETRAALAEFGIGKII